MKIGILTLPLWNNYGGIIQAYALQEVLKEMGNTVTLINYHHNISGNRILKQRISRFIKHSILNKKNAPYYPTKKENILISKFTQDFLNRNFDNITEVVTTDQQLKNVTDTMDGIFVGSDQVWRPNYTPDITNYFLKFADNDQIKVAYAASFGTDKWLFSKEEEDICKDLIRRFDQISVREDSAIDLVKEKFDKEALQVLDPTMLLDKEDYIKLIHKDLLDSNENKGKIFTYILDENPETEKVIKDIENLTSRKSFKMMPKRFDKNFRNNRNKYIFPPLESWLKSFYDADFVVADSFHGCVFSIIFNKPFIAIGNHERGLARFSSLLKMFHLENRLIVGNYNDAGTILKQEIDWESVNNIRNEQKKRSIEFIKKAFN